MVRGPTNPTQAGNITAEAIEGSLIAGTVIPAFQLALLEFMGAMPTGEFSELSLTVIYSTVIVMGLLPLASTLLAMGFAYIWGGPIALGLYVIISFSASMILGAPVLALFVLLVATAALGIWSMVHSGNNRRGRAGY